MIKLSDYVIDFLVQKGISDIFMVSGGGIMHLVDSVGRNKGMHYYCNYHEQACAVSAEGYARIKKGISACLVTTGPGAVNALSGIVGAWYDSLPVLVISGQVRRDLIADYSRLRQKGPQEGNVVAMAKPVTKYAKTILEPEKIRYELEYAFAQATSGRPGPVWLDIPLDVQGSMIEEDKLAPYDPQDSTPAQRRAKLSGDVRQVVEVLRTSKRPLLLGGNGIHLSQSEDLLHLLLERTGIPIVLPLTSKDLVAEDQPLYAGIFGATGQRRANFAVQNSDCILSLGAGLCCQKVGFNYNGFAPKAKKMVVDIDEGQLYHQPVKADLRVQADVREFMEELLHQLDHITLALSPKWIEACTRWKQRYPIILKEYYKDTKHVNSYVFMDTLADLLEKSDVLVAGSGLDTVSYYQAFKVKKEQRTMTSCNWGAMGWDLPLTIGACIANGKKKTVCVTGDGSIQWNVQELMTIRHYNLPVKIFIFNNQGFSSIRATQNAFFEGRFVGADRGSGISNPDFEKLAGAYGLGYEQIRNNEEIKKTAGRVLAAEGPVLCEVNIAIEQGITPKSSAFRREDGTFESKPLEDMAPFLPREEVWENMHLFDEDDK